MNRLLNVGIIIGGRSVEHDISLISGSQAKYMVDEIKYKTTIFYIDYDNKIYVNDVFNDILNFKSGLYKNYLKKDNEVALINISNKTYYYFIYRKRKFNLIDVFLSVVHGEKVEDGTISGFLDMYLSTYTQSNLIDSAVLQDKAYTKAYLNYLNIATTPFKVIYENDFLDDFNIEINYPIIVKPARLGSSIGINIINRKDDLFEKLSNTFKYTNKIIIEKALTNFIEYNCAVINNKTELICSNVEIINHLGNIYTFDDKYINNEKNSQKQYLQDSLLKDEIWSISKKIYREFDLKGVVRIDYLYDLDSETLYVNEINNIPGSLSFYLFNDILSCEKLIDCLIESSILNKQKELSKDNHFESNVFKVKNLKLDK